MSQQPNLSLQFLVLEILEWNPCTTMATTLSLFWNLSSASKEERITATVKLVNSLEKFQGQHTPKPEGSPTSEDDEENVGPTDGLDVLNAHDVAYSIRRLIRGLASPRESSRLGFSVALTEVRISTFENYIATSHLLVTFST
jgi:DNA polymerase phi